MDGRGRSGGASAGLRAAVAARTRRHSLRSASLWVCCWVAWGLHIFLAGFFMGGQRGKEGGRLHAGLVVARETERNGWVGMEFVRLFIPYVTGLRAAAVVSVSRHSRCVRRACVPSLCVCVCFFCENISLSIYRMEADAILCRCLVFPFPCRVSFSINDEGRSMVVPDPDPDSLLFSRKKRKIIATLFDTHGFVAPCAF
jgi:hypothetical protein